VVEEVCAKDIVLFRELVIDTGRDEVLVDDLLTGESELSSIPFTAPFGRGYNGR